MLSGGRLLVGGLGVVALAAGASAVALKAGVGAPSARLQPDSAALTRVAVSGHGAHLESVHATGPGGAAIPVSVRDGRVWPTVALPVGEKVVITATITRSAPVSWVLGRTFRLQRAVRTPKARISSRWLEVPAGSPIKLSFAAPVDRVSIRSGSHHAVHKLPPTSRSLTLPGSVSASSARTVLVAAAPRSWETLPDHVPVTWFAAGGLPKVVATPRPGAAGLGPGAMLRLTFSRPVSEIFGKRLPTLSPSTPGRWRQLDAHTLAFAPHGAGFGIDAKIRVGLPRAVQLAGRPKGTRTLTWSGAAGSTLRLQQLLANLGYLPVQWAPVRHAGPGHGRGATGGGDRSAGRSLRLDLERRSRLASLRVAPRPDHPDDTGRDHGVPGPARAQGRRVRRADRVARPDRCDDLRHAQHAGLQLRARPQDQAAVADAVARRHGAGERAEQHGHSAGADAGRDVPRVPPPAIADHVGHEPRRQHYSDAGIKWISYFHAGEAIHGFDRTSYGSPQSLGCVELPVSEAARV